MASGNPAPVFAFPAHRVVYADAAGSDHIRCTLAAADGKRIKAIAFRAMGTELGELLLSERQLPLHVGGPADGRRLVRQPAFPRSRSKMPHASRETCQSPANPPIERPFQARAPFVYRLGRQPFTLQRRVRLP